MTTNETKNTSRTIGRTVTEIAAGLSRGEYEGSERFLTFSTERAAASDLLSALKGMLKDNHTAISASANGNCPIRKAALAAIRRAEGK